MIVPKIILIGFPPNKKSHPAKRDRVVQTFDFKVRAVFIYLRQVFLMTLIILYNSNCFVNTFRKIFSKS